MCRIFPSLPVAYLICFFHNRNGTGQSSLLSNSAVIRGQLQLGGYTVAAAQFPT